MKFAIAFLSCVVATGLLAQSKPTADLIITNAKVWTVDKAHPTAQAVAVVGDRIIAVGSNAEVEVLRGTATKVIDAGGNLLLPGFNDAHVHFVEGGLQLDSVQLNDATSTDEFVRRFMIDVLPDYGFHRIRHYGFQPRGTRFPRSRARDQAHQHVPDHSRNRRDLEAS